MTKSGIFGVLLLGAVVLSGCEEADIMYEGKLMKESEAEELIADKLEVDNPELDLEVNIYPEEEEE